MSTFIWCLQDLKDTGKKPANVVHVASTSFAGSYRWVLTNRSDTHVRRLGHEQSGTFISSKERVPGTHRERFVPEPRTHSSRFLKEWRGELLI